MNQRFSHLLQHRSKRRKGDSAQLAAQLAPLEEQESREQTQGSGVPVEAQRGAIQESGAIIVGGQDLRLSRDITEAKASGKFLGLEPVVLVILFLLLAFIGFIAWQIWRMPPELVEKLLG